MKSEISKIIVLLSNIIVSQYIGVTFAVIGQGNAVSGDKEKPEIHSNKSKAFMLHPYEQGESCAVVLRFMMGIEVYCKLLAL